MEHEIESESRPGISVSFSFTKASKDKLTLRVKSADKEIAFNTSNENAIKLGKSLIQMAGGKAASAETSE